MKRIKIFATLFFLLVSCSNGNKYGLGSEHDEYDYIVGSDDSNLVKVTFRYGNTIPDKYGTGKEVGDVYKIWGIPEKTILYSLEPKYPNARGSNKIRGCWYGLNKNFRPFLSDTGFIDLWTYEFTKDVDLYCKWFGNIPEIELYFSVEPGGPYLIPSASVRMGTIIQNSGLYSGTMVYKMPGLGDGDEMNTELGRGFDDLIRTYDRIKKGLNIAVTSAYYEESIDKVTDVKWYDDPYFKSEITYGYQIPYEKTWKIYAHIIGE